jgi:hypothetical protein
MRVARFADTPLADTAHARALSHDGARARTTSGPATRRTVAAPIALLVATLLAGAWTSPAAAAPSTVRRCGTVAVPSTQSRAAVSLRGRSLPCTTVRRVVVAAYRRSVLIGDTRPFALRDAGRTWRCRYTPSSGGMVCEATGRRLRGTI